MPTPFYKYPLSSCPTLTLFRLYHQTRLHRRTVPPRIQTSPSCNGGGNRLRLRSISRVYRQGYVARPSLPPYARAMSTASAFEVKTTMEVPTSLTYGKSSTHPKHCLCLLQSLELTHVCVKALRLALASFTNTFKQCYRQVTASVSLDTVHDVRYIKSDSSHAHLFRWHATTTCHMNDTMVFLCQHFQVALSI
jgi:hypothetical protein